MCGLAAASAFAIEIKPYGCRPMTMDVPSARELIADAALEGREWCGQQLGAKRFLVEEVPAAQTERALEAGVRPIGTPIALEIHTNVGQQSRQVQALSLCLESTGHPSSGSVPERQQSVRLTTKGT